jgi:hypothetical protein
MNADARKDLRVLGLTGIFVSQPDGAVGRVRSLAVADRKIGFNPAVLRPRQHFVAIGVVAFAFKMCVRVDEHDCGETGASPVQTKIRGETGLAASLL